MEEYGVGRLCGFLGRHRGVMIRAEYGGCGKSHTCEAMASRGHRALFVCPTNQLACKHGEHAAP